MNTKSVLGLGLSGILLLAGPAALADKDNSQPNSSKARAVQVHIDKDTGRKTVPDDLDADTASLSAESPAVVDASGTMSARNQPLQHRADGSMSIRFGTESLKFVVLTIGDDGQKKVTHQSIDELAVQAEEQSFDTGAQ